ncbi:PAS domain-containing protein [Temperatibacter marinus]|uniref:PAS domain-containing protein n=1 Tax=Temperatibacter marinus TaxID=1456591 RepID=A0AA52H8B0_9PROT|nr:PAS domain-containing protein [Temperatibacter marinus]WND01941.1 PAS domain-containing protein [Temperatibacter marinus]
MIISQLVKDFLTYWQSIKMDGQIIPLKSNFKPFEVPECVPYLSVLEVEDPSETIEQGKEDNSLCVRIKLTGTNVYERYQMELTGTNILDLFPAEDRHPLYEGFKSLIAHPAGIWRRMISPHRRNFHLYDESLILPLYDERRDKNIPILLSVAKDIAEQEFITYSEDGGHIQKGNEHLWIDIGKGVPGPFSGLTTNQFLAHSP